MAVVLWPVQLLLTGLSLALTCYIRPQVLNNYRNYPVGLILPLLVLGSLLAMIWTMRQGKEKAAFLSSSLYIIAMLGGAAFALYPVVLPASTDPSYSLTIANTAAGGHGLAVGLTWWSLGTILAIAYFVFVFRMFRGKVRLEGGGY
jgi:cytochrome d ubiquinol oxidase subunit II